MKRSPTFLQALVLVVTVAGAVVFVAIRIGSNRAHSLHPGKGQNQKRAVPKYSPLNTAEYDRRMRLLMHLSTNSVAGFTPVPISTVTAKAAPTPQYPKAGALLPFHRIVAFYGNFHSKQMGIVGEFDEAEVLKRLKSEVSRWNLADPGTPVLPAIHYVAVIAQGSPGEDGKYRLRTSKTELERVLRMARKAGGVAFFDIQLGRSSVEAEVPKFDSLLKHPDVHLGLDPEFAMKGDKKPGQTIGTMDAREINWTVKYLSKLVDQYDLPPKILIVHRFVPKMITNLRLIRSTPQVQVVIDMDGWGRPDEKKKVYKEVIQKSRVTLAGLKIFYKNDTRAGSNTMTPAQVLQLNPAPIYIQYQ